jgi:hypothetical protein
MKQHGALISLLALSALAGPAAAQIYRCGNNEYTNTVTEANKANCKLVEGGNLTVVQSVRPPPPPAAGNQAVRVASAPSAGARTDSAEQRNRDSDARLILESELRKAESRHAELAREYNNGEPEKRGDEARNYQKYIDRVAELKASLARNESDIAGIRREIARLPAGK